MSYEVVNPVGEPAAKEGPGATRLDTLEGKTVCEVCLTKYRGDQTFPIIREMLQQRYSTVKVIPYTEFPLNESPLWQGIKQEETAEAYREAFKRHGCDAVISGNGG